MRRGGEDELPGHGQGGGLELLLDSLRGATPFVDVAVCAALEAKLSRSLDVDGNVQERAEIGVMEGKDALDDEEGVGFDADGSVRHASVMDEVVAGAVDSVPDDELPKLLDEQRQLERVGMIEVLPGAFRLRQMIERAVVGVEREQGAVESAAELAGKGGFARARGAGDADDHRAVRVWARGGRGHGRLPRMALTRAVKRSLAWRPISRTSWWSMGSAEIPAAALVTSERPRTSMPIWRATMTS